jgi:hypothetical protein
MKIWLRSLPEPLVPFQLYQAAVDAGASNDPSDALQVSYEGCFEREGKRDREREKEKERERGRKRWTRACAWGKQVEELRIG